MVHRNINVAVRYHEFVISVQIERLAQQSGFRSLPAAFPAIPRVQQIGKPIVRDARDRPDHRQSDEPPEPDVTRRSKPDRDHAVDPGVKPVRGIDGMQPAPDVVDPDAEAGERIRLEIDVTKIDCARSSRANQSMLLPVNAGVTDRTFGVVPNCEFFHHHAIALDTCRASSPGYVTFLRLAAASLRNGVVAG
jgi:hypothetical protein